MTKTAALVAAVNGVLSALVLLGVFSLTADQLAGVGIAVNGLAVAIASFFDPAIPWYGTKPPASAGR